MPTKTQQGFSLIELMVVLAIIGLLAAIALPAYQDYIIRTRVLEGLILASAAKANVSQSASSVLDLKVIADDFNMQSGGNGLTSKYVKKVIIDDSSGAITIVYDETSLGIESNKNILILSPYIQNGTATPMSLQSALNSGTSGPVDWICASDTNAVAQARNMASGLGTLTAKYAPSECR